jgi:C-terminal processing protease CtpA/Prc
MIIDLRNNGGGSLPEAVKMAGLFFPKGPVVQIKTKEGNPDDIWMIPIRKPNTADHWWL